MNNIASQIKELRKKVGWTQVEFSKRAGVGLRFLRELEQGKLTVRMDKVTRVLDFLGYHLELKKRRFSLEGKKQVKSEWCHEWDAQSKSIL